MDALSSFYKETSTSRGLRYNYYFSPADSGKPTLLLVHGFPSLAADWVHQITYFKAKGYGIVAPDMLGYGGTDKPEDPSFYLHTLLAKDLVDILDHEKVENVLALGHDWGSRTTSVLANLYSDRFLGFGFFSVGYLVPNTHIPYEQVKAKMAETFGYENLGYWEFFSAPDANEIIKKNLEAFWNVIHAKDTKVWKDVMGPTGGFRAFLESGANVDRADYFPEELLALYNKTIDNNTGFNGPLNYYRIMTRGLDMEDAKNIPLDKYVIQKPVFFGGTAKDPVCIPALAMATLPRFCPNATTEIFQTGHWVLLEAPQEVNEALDKWISSVIA